MIVDELIAKMGLNLDRCCCLLIFPEDKFEFILLQIFRFITNK